jgi:SAM-dependent methyltransferase
MTGKDVEFFMACSDAGFIRGHMLEIGSAKVQGTPNLCDLARELGVEATTGVDMQLIDGVDAVFDFSLSTESFKTSWRLGRFSTVCIFNVLEHTFDPLTILSNALQCVEPGGSLIVVVPSAWPIHRYPADYVRLLPDWYQKFADINKITLRDSHFCWLSDFGVEVMDKNNIMQLPGFISRGLKASKTRYWASRLIHKLFNTYGRSHWATNSAIGAVFQIP